VLNILPMNAMYRQQGKRWREAAAATELQARVPVSDKQAKETFARMKADYLSQRRLKKSTGTAGGDSEEERLMQQILECEGDEREKTAAAMKASVFFFSGFIQFFGY